VADHQKIAATIRQIEKMHGANAVVRLGSKKIVPVPVISTGVLSIDAALGVGGFARGRIAEIYGPESGGKTTLALQVVAQAQMEGGAAAFIDAEHALDLTYARKLGVDVENLYVAQPDNGEQALEIAEALIKSGEIDVVVVDSVSALVPKAELEGEMGQPQMGLQARLMSQAMRKLTAIVAHTKTCVIFINQIRYKIGVMYGNPETTSGGIALKFSTSHRVHVQKSTKIKEGENVVGNVVKIRVEKNKLGAPYQEAEVEMLYGQGFSCLRDLLKLARQHGLIEANGAWITYGGERWHGQTDALEALATNVPLRKKLTEEVRTKLFSQEG
jgi:recombination protein RecA